MLVHSPINNGYLTSIIILILASIHLGVIGAMEKDYLSMLLNYLAPVYGRNILRCVYVVVGLVGLYMALGVNYHTFLPFLDKTVLPPSVLLLSEQSDTNVKLEVNGDDAIKVVYWAAHSDNGVIEENPKDAYAGFENVGISAVVNGKATLKLKCPTKYKAMKKVLPKHVHYRLIYENGVLSEVRTLKLTKYCD